MKAREIPPSIYHSLKYHLTPVHRLGVNATQAAKPLIVSMTSIEPRLPILHIVLKALLDQTLTPELIVVWLNHSLKDQIPKSVKQLIGPKVKIKYSNLDSPHLKLVESLQKYPEHLIATCDDDFIYPRNWLARLYQEHLDNPAQIIAHESRKIRCCDKGDVLAYREWKKPLLDSTGLDILPLGYGGVLYPSQSLHKLSS